MAASPLSLANDAAWNRYASCVFCGATPLQRRWAFEKALEAQEKLAKVESAEQRRRKTAEAKGTA